MPDTTDAPGASKAKPKPNAAETPESHEPATQQPVASHQPGKPHGERQDGAGTAPPRPERTEATAAGSTHARRAGADAGQPEEPDAEHRGQPALFKTGSTSGSGAHAGGTRAGGTEEPATDSAGGGGREGRGG
jgi:hypothetical protein